MYICMNVCMYACMYSMYLSMCGCSYIRFSSQASRSRGGERYQQCECNSEIYAQVLKYYYQLKYLIFTCMCVFCMYVLYVLKEHKLVFAGDSFF